MIVLINLFQHFGWINILYVLQFRFIWPDEVPFVSHLSPAQFPCFRKICKIPLSSSMYQNQQQPFWFLFRYCCCFFFWMNEIGSSPVSTEKHTNICFIIWINQRQKWIANRSTEYNRTKEKTERWEWKEKSKGKKREKSTHFCFNSYLFRTKTFHSTMI